MRACIAILILVTSVLPIHAEADEPDRRGKEVFLLPYFLGNGETGVYFAFSNDGLKFEWLNDGKVVMPVNLQ